METLGIPCLITAYRRLDLVTQLLKNIAPSGPRLVYLSIDGPKNPQDAQDQQDALKEVVEAASESKIEIKILHRAQNRGLAAAIISSLDWFYEHEIAGAILEDDSLPTESFFDWIKFANENFRNETEILIYSGHQFFPKENPPNALSWVNYPVIGAWGTTREKWHVLRKLLLETHQNFGQKQSFNSHQFWKGGKMRCEAGLVDSWAIPLAEGMRSNNYLSVLPPVNLVINAGDDDRAIHTSRFLPEYFKTSTEFGDFGKLLLLLNYENVHKNNKLFESIVYNIRFHHFLLPIRVRLQLLARKFFGGRIYSLQERVKLAESDLLNPQLFTRNDIK